MKKILMLSNMYPSKEHPSFGVFVKNFETNLITNEIAYDKIVILKSNNKLEKLVRYLVFFLKTFFCILFKKYSVIYIHYASITSIPVIWAAKFKSIKIYTNVHGTDVDPVTKKEIKLENNTRKIIRISDRVVVPSSYFKELVSNKYAFDDEDIIIYPSGGIDTSTFYSKQEKISTKQKAESSRLVTLGYVSRIEKEKGWNTLLEAIYKLKKNNKGINVKLIIVGEGSEKEELERYIRKYDLESMVELHSFVDQATPCKLYNKLDLFIFPTRKESLGLVGIEAMACGIPVLGSDIPPLASYIKHGLNGFLFSKDNSDDLLDQISHFLNLSEDSIELMKDQALETSKLYSKDSIENSFIKIFK